MEIEKKLISRDECIKGSTEYNYEDKLLIIKPEALNPLYQSAEFQYFYAQGGFGCDPTKLGTKVFGKFLDGDNGCFHRGEFYGVADETKLPDYVKEKLKEFRQN